MAGEHQVRPYFSSLPGALKAPLLYSGQATMAHQAMATMLAAQ